MLSRRARRTPLVPVRQSAVPQIRTSIRRIVFVVELSPRRFESSRREAGPHVDAPEVADMRPSESMSLDAG